MLNIYSQGSVSFLVCVFFCESSIVQRGMRADQWFQEYSCHPIGAGVAPLVCGTSLPPIALLRSRKSFVNPTRKMWPRSLFLYFVSMFSFFYHGPLPVSTFWQTRRACSITAEDCGRMNPTLGRVCGRIRPNAKYRSNEERFRDMTTHWYNIQRAR